MRESDVATHEEIMEPQSGLPSAGKEQSSGAPRELPPKEIIWKPKIECLSVSYQAHNAMSKFKFTSRKKQWSFGKRLDIMVVFFIVENS